jgi:DNA-binding CsgD family transcriptional regulator
LPVNARQVHHLYIWSSIRSLTESSRVGSTNTRKIVKIAFFAGAGFSMSRVGSEWLSRQQSSRIELFGGADRIPPTDRCGQYPVSVTATSSSGTLPEGRDDELEGFWLVLVNHPPAEWLAMIGDHKQLIGRSPDADLRVPDQFRTVSRRHAEIWSDQHGVNLRDLGSTAGTRINDAYIGAETTVRLRAGDRITLGKLQLILGDGATPVLRGAEELLGDQEQTTFDNIDKHSLLLRSRLEQLTPAEIEILLWISRGVLNDEAIGKLTHRSPNTVRTHVSKVLRKLGLHSRGEVWGFLRCSA